MRELTLFFVLSLFIGTSTTRDIIVNNEKCRTCNFLVATFDEGLRKTARNHFGGGDTAWEEQNLGKYATSETRLIEAMEGICKKSTLKTMDGFTGISEIEFKCSSQMEEHEETIEEYYYKEQNNNMTIWLCVEKLRLCCPEGHYGKDCSKCPAVEEGASACFGRGQCHGEGTREGSGACKCDEGYVGKQCRHCDNDFFLVNKDDTSVACQKCYTGCTGGCTGEGAVACRKCRLGWTMEEGLGCVDVDECKSDNACTRDNEKCVNTEGSFSCECADGYKKIDGNCQLDIEASPRRPFLPLDQLLKIFAMTSLVGIVTIVVWRRSVVLYVLVAAAVIAIIFIELYLTPDSIPDRAKSILL